MQIFAKKKIKKTLKKKVLDLAIKPKTKITHRGANNIKVKHKTLEILKLLYSRGVKQINQICISHNVKKTVMGGL